MDKKDLPGTWKNHNHASGYTGRLLGPGAVDAYQNDEKDIVVLTDEDQMPEEESPFGVDVTTGHEYVVWKMNMDKPRTTTRGLGHFNDSKAARERMKTYMKNHT